MVYFAKMLLINSLKKLGEINISHNFSEIYMGGCIKRISHDGTRFLIYTPSSCMLLGLIILCDANAICRISVIFLLTSVAVKLYSESIAARSAITEQNLKLFRPTGPSNIFSTPRLGYAMLVTSTPCPLPPPSVTPLVHIYCS